ncbi:MAG: CopG family transcriptional regulator [Candidatus Micrarchaeota archaeon]
MIRKSGKRKSKFTTISIPVPLYEKTRAMVEGTGFTSVSDYVTFVLRELIAGTSQDKTKQVFTRADERMVKGRLKALGYID